MKPSELKNILDEEVGAILSSDFKINVSSTTSVPHFDDSTITFPNFDSLQQGCKVIDTCVLYIDIRRSTELNLTHRATTVAKLYSAFVRSMTRCAQKNDGHVRGIIGDRVMVIFNSSNCFVNAVETAISMNSTSQYVINKYFKRNEVSCGVGIDAGKMLATKTGLRKRGRELQNYRNLVWLGRPANIASKLTDAANKAADVVNISVMRVGRNNPQGTAYWRNEYCWDYLKNIGADNVIGPRRHKDPTVFASYLTSDTVELSPKTPPILMTKTVYDGFRAMAPDDQSIRNNWWAPVTVNVSGYSGGVIGGDVIWTAFK